MDNLDDSENNAKVSDSAYSNSCQSRRSHSSKSTHSGSNSSGSSGYGGKQSTSGSSPTLCHSSEKRTKDKEGKKKKQAQIELDQIQTDVEFRLPDPAPVTEVVEELQNGRPNLWLMSNIPAPETPGYDHVPSETNALSSPPPTSDQTQIGVDRSLEIVPKEDTAEKPESCSFSQISMQLVPAKSVYPEGFSCVISLHDGVVLYMSSTLSATLGFPKDMWIGRSFIDFVHPLDHNTFASQVTKALAVPKEVNTETTGNIVSTIFCRIRKYRSLSMGFNVKERALAYMPFMLRLSLKSVYEESGSIVYLVITATPVFSAYKTHNELVDDAVPFVMRHVANGTLEYMDNEAVPFLGYLPQDIISKNLLKLYHPEDLPYVTHLYETIVKQGRASRSKSYRLLAQNGDYVKLETEWSSFINPWSRKLEFVIMKHYIVEGPTIPDVFQSPLTPSAKSIKLADEDAIEVQGRRESIVNILNEIGTRPADHVMQQMTKRCQDLTSLMESLIEDQPKPDEELRLEIQENDNSYYERDSVMLGGISPHHDNDDSKSSTETPLSYNQLNYNISLKRFFDSHQEAFPEDVSNAEKTLVAMRGQVYAGQSLSPVAQDSCDSVEMTSVESAYPSVAEDSQLSLPRPHDYQPIRLTESILNRHNSDMEKIFVKKHRETRPSKEEREKRSNETKQKKRDHLVRCNASFVPTPEDSVMAEPKPHGLKRASKQNETEQSMHKQHCATSRQMRRPQPAGPTTPQPSVSTAAPVWPQNYANGTTPFVSPQMPLVSPITTMQGFVPIYYLPAAGSTVPCTPGMGAQDSARNPAHPQQFQAPAGQYMYGQAVFGSPITVSSVSHQATFPRPQSVIQRTLTCAQTNVSLAARNYEEALKPTTLLKPAGMVQPLSIRSAAPRSARITMSSTDILIRSSEEVPEPALSQDSKMKSNETMDRTDGESSYSSFYNSSFFKTESGSADDSGDSKNRRSNSVHSASASIPSKHNLRNRMPQRRKKEPPWMEQVNVTSDLIYKYQVLTKSLDEVLISDRKKLAEIEQPSLVNEQLGQLYADLQMEGVAACLTLEEGITSSGSSSEDGHKFAIDTMAKRTSRKRKYSKLGMIYEEEAPLPSPESPEPQPSTSFA